MKQIRFVLKHNYKKNKHTCYVTDILFIDLLTVIILINNKNQFFLLMLHNICSLLYLLFLKIILIFILRIFNTKNHLLTNLPFQ